jgi:ferredoxin
MAGKKPRTFNFQGKDELKFLDFCRNYPEQVIPSHESSPTEGFEYLFSIISNGSMDIATDFSPRDRLKQFTGDKKIISALKWMLRLIRKITKWRKGSFRDLKPYYREIQSSVFINKKSKELTHDEILWKELNEHAKDKWDIMKIGFTELPPQLIFKNKFVLFRNALVFMQEMIKEEVDQAPLPPAGREAMRVYSTLGEAVGEIARWLRKKGIRCQANHPLGGLVCTPPLAGKAGMGWQGRHGLLITPEFGPRQRLAPIFIEEKIFNFTDNSDHVWIEKQCENCGICQKNCPPSAIFGEKILSIEGVDGIGAMRTCIDREKCFPQFLKTAGCSICMKVCPFSNGNEAYEKLKAQVL